MKFVLLCSLACAFAAHGDGPITFPRDGGVLDVRDFGGAPDESADDTAAIQKALDAFPAGNRIIHLAPGAWIVSDTLRWPDGSHGGFAQKRTILQGAGERLTTLRLPEAAAGFTDAAKSKPLIWTGNKPAQRFRNAVRDLTIEVGAGNPGAIALQFNASNQGCIRNVTLRASPGSGLIGLDMGFTDEIGPLLVKRLTVDGFETGIVTKWPVNSLTFEHVTLRGQRHLGWHNYHQMIFVRGLRSENAVTALLNAKDSWGTVTLLDSQIIGTGPAAKTSGIRNERQMVLRNVEVRGYTLPIDHADKGRDKGDITAPGLITGDTSHANVASLFRGIADGTLASAGPVGHLPVKETPEIAWGDPEKDWANLASFGADATGITDSSPALQAAIDSGARTIYLPAGAEFRFDAELEIRGPVERIVGLEGRFVTEGQAVWKLVDGRHPRGLADARTVIIERMSNRSGGSSVTIRHASQRALVVSSAIGFHVEGRGTGDIFIEDLSGQLMLEEPGQSAWARQLNTESSGVMLRNRGGRLWLLGMKTEKIGTIIETIAGGVTDAAGVFIYSNQGWRDGVPAFVIRDARAVIAGISERNFNQRPVSLWVREMQGRETRELTERPWVYLSQ